MDNVTCLKHIALENGVLLSYRSKSEEAKRMTAKKVAKQHRMRVVPDKESEYSPPDCAEIFKAGSERKSNNATPLLVVYTIPSKYSP